MIIAHMEISYRNFKTGRPTNIVGSYTRTIPIRVPAFLIHSYYMPGVSCFWGSPYSPCSKDVATKASSAEELREVLAADADVAARHRWYSQGLK